MAPLFDSQLFLSRPYLTKNQIIAAQRNTINDRRTYNQKKLSILNFLSELCLKLQLPRKTLETSLYFYQRYHLFNNFETELCYTVATSCLVISCKQVETFKKVNEITSISLQIRNMNKVNNEMLEAVKKKICQIELRILEACCFDYRINNNVHMDEFIIKIGKRLSLDYEVCQLAWIIAYDALKLDVILINPPPTIALATLRVAFELFDKNDWPTNIYDVINTEASIVNDIFFHLINFYINAFDHCDLKYHMPPNIAPISIERFIQIKGRCGNEVNMNDVLDEDIKYDDFLVQPRHFSVQERRYILSPEMMQEEANALSRI